MIFHMRNRNGILALAMTTCLANAVTGYTNPALAGYYDFPLSGYHLACSDGETTAAAVFPGIGSMLYQINGSFANSFPVIDRSWSPVIGGTSLCWSRPMSGQTQRKLIANFYRYCVQLRRYYCRYE